jgi:hypothetical protein
VQSPPPSLVLKNTDLAQAIRKISSDETRAAVESISPREEEKLLPCIAPASVSSGVRPGVSTGPSVTEILCPSDDSDLDSSVKDLADDDYTSIGNKSFTGAMEIEKSLEKKVSNIPKGSLTPSKVSQSVEKPAQSGKAGSTNPATPPLTRKIISEVVDKLFEFCPMPFQVEECVEILSQVFPFYDLDDLRYLVIMAIYAVKKFLRVSQSRLTTAARNGAVIPSMNDVPCPISTPLMDDMLKSGVGSAGEL